MEFLVLDKDLSAVQVVDISESVIWSDRYFKCGDFEIDLPIDTPFLSFLKEDYYLWYGDSEHTMIIEKQQILSDVESGAKLVVTGRSLESILDRRIIWNQTILTGNFQNGIKKLLDENAIAPSDANRRIPNLIFEASTDPAVTELTIDAQYYGENLYDSVQSLCESGGIGFKITLTDDGFFKFKLYSGTDRSYSQVDNPFVVFSPNFDNLLNSNYVRTKSPLKTVTLVIGEGGGANQKTTTVEIKSGGGSGLDRREMFTDASGVSSTIEGGTLTDADYTKQIAQKGAEDLSKNTLVISFEGQVDTLRTFKYGEDFFMGDIVQVANEYGIESRSMIIEVVRSQSTSGVDVYPTFATIQ